MDITKMKHAVVFLIFVMVYSFGNVYAQVSSSVFKDLEKTREDQKVINKEAPRQDVVIQKGTDALDKKLAEPDKKVFVKKFKVEGNTKLSSNDIASIVAPYEGKDLTINDIQNVGALLAAEYQKKGYVVNVSIPAQDISSHVIVINVLEGMLGKVTASGNTSYSSAFIEKHFAGVNKDSALSEQSLERPLLLLNEYPSLKVVAVPVAGKERGKTDIIAKVTDQFPISGSLFYDNYGEKITSKNRAGLSLDVGNIVTSGDRFNLWGISGIDSMNLKDLAYGRAEYSLPIGGNGTRVGGYYGNSVFRADQELATVDLEGSAKSAGIYVSHPFVKKVGLSVAAKLGVDYKYVEQNTVVDGLPVETSDDIRSANLGVTCDFRDNLFGVNYIGLNYVQGLSSVLGGSKRDDSNLSDAGRIDVDFSKYTADLVRMQKLPGYNYLMLRAAGQYSADKLYGAEQYSIGGVNSVRGFKSSQYSGDTGYALTAELALSPFFADTSIGKQKVGDTIKFALFGDYGWVKQNDVAAGADDDDEDLKSIGAGVRLYIGKFFSCRLDYAIPCIEGKYRDADSRTYVQAIFSF